MKQSYPNGGLVQGRNELAHGLAHNIPPGGAGFYMQFNFKLNMKQSYPIGGLVQGRNELAHRLTHNIPPSGGAGLIKWSTLNGAEFFGLHREYGSFEKGKKPGVNLICNVDMERFSLEDASYVIPLV